MPAGSNVGSGTLVAPSGAAGPSGPQGLGGPPGGDFYGTDTTNNGTYAVTVASGFGLVTAVVVFFSVSTENPAANPTLNVNNTGAKPLVTKGGLALNQLDVRPNRVHGVFYDGTNWCFFTYLTRYYYYTAAATLSCNCLGYDKLYMFLNMSSSGTLAVTLNNLGIGATVMLRFFNAASGSAISYTVAATNEAGTSTPVIYVPAGVAGGAPTSLSTAASIANNACVFLVGAVDANNLTLR